MKRPASPKFQTSLKEILKGLKSRLLGGRKWIPGKIRCQFQIDLVLLEKNYVTLPLGLLRHLLCCSEAELCNWIKSINCGLFSSNKFLLHQEYK